MRTITELMSRAFFNGETKQMSNTQVQNYEMYLFGNRIAWIYDGKLYFTLCGWNTQTTRERLNGLGVKVTQKNYKLYWNGKEINDHEVYEMAI